VTIIVEDLALCCRLYTELPQVEDNDYDDNNADDDDDDDTVKSIQGFCLLFAVVSLCYIYAYI